MLCGLRMYACSSVAYREWLARAAARDHGDEANRRCVSCTGLQRPVVLLQREREKQMTFLEGLHATHKRTHAHTHTHTKHTYIKGIYMDTFSGVILCMFVCAYGYAYASICVGRCVSVCPCLCLFVCARGTARVYCVWTWRSLALIVSVSWRHDRGSWRKRES